MIKYDKYFWIAQGTGVCFSKAVSRTEIPFGIKLLLIFIVSATLGVLAGKCSNNERN